jgi:hypothetical protein
VEWSRPGERLKVGGIDPFITPSGNERHLRATVAHDGYCGKAPGAGGAICARGSCGRGEVELRGLMWRIRCRERDELRQFPQILGGGGQQELVFRSARATQAQSIEPEYALQVSECISTF